MKSSVPRDGVGGGGGGAAAAAAGSASASSSSPAKTALGFGTGLSRLSLPKFKHVDEKKRADTGRLQKRLANIKKKLEELCVLCDTQGFLICFSPSLGVETWPESRGEILPVIRRYLECKGKVGWGEESEKSGTTLASLLAVVRQEQGEQGKVGALIRVMCGDRGIDEMGLGEIREVISRTNSAIEALNGVLASLAIRNKGSPKRDVKEENLIEGSKNQELDLTLSL